MSKSSFFLISKRRGSINCKPKPQAPASLPVTILNKPSPSRPQVAIKSLNMPVKFVLPVTSQTLDHSPHASSIAWFAASSNFPFVSLACACGLIPVSPITLSFKSIMKRLKYGLFMYCSHDFATSFSAYFSIIWSLVYL